MISCIWHVDDENVVYTTLWEVTFIDGTNSTISEKDSNLDEKNKRHTSLLVPAIGTSKDRGCYDVYIRSLHLSYISLRWGLMIGEIVYQVA